MMQQLSLEKILHYVAVLAMQANEQKVYQTD
jgi:hypothetical protein